MNFLAHLYIADVTNDSLIGHLMGDIVKGKAFLSYEPEIRDAILFHRKIDTFSDGHSVTRTSRNRISKQRRRFAGVSLSMSVMITSWRTTGTDIPVNRWRISAREFTLP